MTLGSGPGQIRCEKITGKGQVTIPRAMREKHGLLPQREVEFVDQPTGVLRRYSYQRPGLVPVVQWPA